jgi:oxaloacetate decarboxylase gamma subunit
MITEGFELMLIGMGTVFAFLVLLVLCMHLMGKFADRIAHLLPAEEEHPQQTARAAAGAAALTAAAASQSASARIATVIAAAHRARN